MPAILRFTLRRMVDHIHISSTKCFIGMVLSYVSLYVGNSAADPTVTVPAFGGIYGQNTTLNCTEQGFDASMGYLWKKGTTTIYSNAGERFTTGKYSHEDIADGVSLIIINTTRDDADYYSCEYNFYNSESAILNVIVLPQPPEISNMIGANPPRVIATEDQSTALVCMSRGGYPRPTVEWYRGSTQLSTTNVTSFTESDNTYTVTVTYTFTPRKSDDLDKYRCMSSFTNARILEQTAVIQLYLNFKPSQPIVTVISTPMEGQQGVEVASCSTDGFLPSEGLVITWSYKDTSRIHQGSAIADNNTYKITATYTYTAAIGRVDNGGILSCSVNHGTLIAPLVGSVSLTVRFPPLSAEISGTNAVVVDGANIVQLTCTAGTANPGVSDIKWTVNGHVISNTRDITRTSGQYEGEVASQILEITPTRDMTGQEVKCFVSNVLNSNSPISSQGVSLELIFPPLSAELSGTTAVVVDGSNTVQLTCTSGTARPGVSVIKWTLNGQVISNTREITRTSGKYGGEVASQVLEITPTRDMAGQEVKCFVSNVVNSNNPVSSQGVSLDLISSDTSSSAGDNKGLGTGILVVIGIAVYTASLEPILLSR